MLPVSCLKLSSFVIKKLHDGGFMFVEDTITGNGDLKPDAERILKSYPDAKKKIKEFIKAPEKKKASVILEEEEACKRIVTFSLRLDILLGGGVPLGKVLEVSGGPGSGKTQFCLQLCISVQLQAALGGLNGEAVYVDTEAGFSPQRLAEIGEGCKTHCCNVARLHNLSIDIITDLQNQSFTKYYYISVTDHLQLLAVVLKLEDLVIKYPKVKLVIIDSIIFPFIPMNDMLKRTKLLCKIIRSLSSLASQKNLAVILTNHLTTRIARGEDQLVPALGECVGHLFDHRLILGYLSSKHNFAGVIFNSPNLKNESASFQIMKGGIRDIQR